MADIKIDPSHGYEVISEKVNMLVNDIDKMLEDGVISVDAAKYLFEQFGIITRICSEYKKLDNEEKNENKPKISF